MVSSPWCCGLAGDAPGGVAEGRGLCRGGARQRQREGDPGHWLPSAFLAVMAPFSSAGGRWLVGFGWETRRAMNPAGRVRIRNIMPIARDYSRASQSFLFACLTRAKHDLKPPGRWCSAGEREDIMKTRFTVALSMLAGAALGGGAIQALHAQATPPVYYVSEIDVSNPDAYAKEYASKSQALI